MKKDLYHKTILTSFFSLLVHLSFVCYNVYLGVAFQDVFALGISVYYFLLCLIVIATLTMEHKIRQKEEDRKNKIRIRNYKLASLMIFVMDFCLIAPMILMVFQPKEVPFGIIPAITMAAYCVYKIVSAVIRYRHSKLSKNPTTILLREIKIISAIVSILTLQHTLIMVNGGMNEAMQKLSLASSIVFIGIIVLFSILSFFKNKKLFTA